MPNRTVFTYHHDYTDPSEAPVDRHTSMRISLVKSTNTCLFDFHVLTETYDKNWKCDKKNSDGACIYSVEAKKLDDVTYSFTFTLDKETFHQGNEKYILVSAVYKKTEGILTVCFKDQEAHDFHRSKKQDKE
eukprot:gene5900-9728_t